MPVLALRHFRSLGKLGTVALTVLSLTILCLITRSAEHRSELILCSSLYVEILMGSRRSLPIKTRELRARTFQCPQSCQSLNGLSWAPHESITPTDHTLVMVGLRSGNLRRALYKSPRSQRRHRIPSCTTARGTWFHQALHGKGVLQHTPRGLRSIVLLYRTSRCSPLDNGWRLS